MSQSSVFWMMWASCLLSPALASRGLETWCWQGEGVQDPHWALLPSGWAGLASGMVRVEGSLVLFGLFGTLLAYNAVPHGAYLRIPRPQTIHQTCRHAQDLGCSFRLTSR